ncbi:AAA family ATPase [Geomonas oryzisoli]|uniref:AAA family ATPase n=1 Tax=Geomonas oryzisoli TaxID=2847992 RepID=A0ABX8JE10_9BACT|nr:AAA family ATPase [Geomonas oryzisoli]QWV94884.1 AAA family ATPase [Geomonas oryzisoli]
MEIVSYSVHNYKSLRNVEIVPTGLTTLIGANASGKTNFADSIDFLSKVYKFGLEMAVSIKGGYENIAFRMMRRSKAPITFVIEVSLSDVETKRVYNFTQSRRSSAESPYNSIKYKHEFSFQAKSEGIKSEYKVVSEVFSVAIREHGKRGLVNYKDIVKISRSDNNIDVAYYTQNTLTNYFKNTLRLNTSPSEDYEQLLSPQELMISTVNNYIIRRFISLLSGFTVFRFSPDISRKPGIPTPNPALSFHGENLPAMVDWLMHKHPASWEVVKDAMKEVVPWLENIHVGYLHTKALGLFFKEENINRPWTVEDISDGTIQTLAMLVSTVDPRSTLLFIEEPENSVHPWIIRKLIMRLRSLSEKKTVIITSHSPVLIDLINPSEAWIIYKQQGETKIKKLIELDPDIDRSWEKGKYKLSDYLDSGLVPNAIPGGVL